MRLAIWNSVHGDNRESIRGGSQFRSTVNGQSTSPFNFIGGDKVFHLNLTEATDPNIPEPSTLAIWALGLLALACYGRRRRS